jgi:hypothetical protein
VVASLEQELEASSATQATLKSQLTKRRKGLRIVSASEGKLGKKVKN